MKHSPQSVLHFCFLILLALTFASPKASAEIYKCQKTYQNKPCSSTQGASRGKEVSLPKLSTYSSGNDESDLGVREAQESDDARFSLKEGAILDTKRGASAQEQRRNIPERPSNDPTSASQKLRVLEQRAQELEKNASNLQKEYGNQNLYGRARTLLVETHVLCTADFERESISLAQRCRELRKQIAEVSKYATSKRTLAR